MKGKSMIKKYYLLLCLIFCIVLTSQSIAAVKPIVRVGIADDKDAPAVKLVGTAKRAGNGSFQLIDGAPWGWIKVGEGALDSLKGLRSFTIMGWLKPESLHVGHGGNRILFCLKKNRSGIDLVHHNNGRMRLSVNEWPDGISNDSSTGKLQVGKWTFFAVSYDSLAYGDSVSWYFSAPSDTPGQSTVSLDQKTSYNAGPVDSDIGPLVVGNFNETMEGYGMDRQFRGEIRALQIFGSSKDGSGALKANEIGSQSGQKLVPAGPPKVSEQWGVYELSFQGTSAGNPYLDVTFGAEFRNGSHTVKVPGFYDGEGVYKIRFSPDRLGRWTYVTQSDQAELGDRVGSFVCIEPTGNNHGPLRIVNTYYLEYTDGSPFYSIGTTAYQWTSVKQSIQEQTVKTLAGSSFNKIRMCVFPKRYSYGNDTEPWQYPFASQNDFTRPNYTFFQNFDKRVHQLLELGIQADVILFHPYDKWGYAAMGKENNAQYVRYMIARLSAYRNVWWSLANEWDVPRIKEAIDWEGIGNILKNEDPHQRFRGIHNWYGSEDHFYDHSRPWITHISTQTHQFYNGIKWRNQYNKPLLFDEMRYEGDVSSGWGNMSSEDMTSYFWMAGLSGGYGTHGDTYRNNSDHETEVRWWAKGGLLVGRSPLRIAFFKFFMETLPIKEMTPGIEDNGNLKNLNNNVYTLSKENEIYVSYVADANVEINLELMGNQPYQFTVIDTWNMKIVSDGTVPSGEFEFETKIPFTALRLISKSRE